MRPWIERLGLAAIPRDWRDTVERDLSEESAPGSLRFAGRAALIGLRLRASRARESASLPRGRFMHDFGRDLRLAVRGVVRRPAYSAAVIATLAVGIGANIAIFSVFNWILFRPMPGVYKPDELVTIRFLRPGARFFVSYHDVADLRDGMPALSGLAASSALSMNVVFPGGADAERVEGEIVTANYFDVLGVTPQAGRRFTSSEERPGPDVPAAIISADLWRRAFASSPDTVGRPLTINGHAFTIVGIAPKGFRGRSLVAPADLWVPTGAHNQAMPSSGADLLSSGADLLTNRRRTLFIDAVGRLRPDASLAQAGQQAAAVAVAIPDFGGRRPDNRSRGIVPTVFPGIGHDVFTYERLTAVWRLLSGAVALVLLLACANAANLLLARALRRRREIALCHAIGASRLRIVRQQFAEGLVLAVVAAAAGLSLARGLTWSFDGMRIVNYLPAVHGVEIDWRVGVFTLAIAILTAVLFSLAPAFASSRIDLQASLKDGITGSRRARGRLRTALVIVQVSISVLLLVGAGLFARTLRNVRSLDLGVDLHGLVTFSVDPTKIGYDNERARRYFDTMLERLRAAPGIQGAAFSWRTPYSLMMSDTAFERAGGTDTASHDAETNRVSPDYFHTLGVPILAGRDFTDREYRADPGAILARVAVVSRRLAHEVFPAGDAVGSHIVLPPAGEPIEIVGVVGDVRGRLVTNDPEPFIYMPRRTVWGSVSVRSSLPFAETAAAIREIARSIEPALPPYDLEPMSVAVDRAISEQRLFARLSGMFAAVAALLASVGIYAMMAGAVTERRREFGIRLALGARTRSVLALVLRGIVPIAVAGIAAGLAGSLALGKVVASRLYGVTPSDPVTLVAVAAGLGALALAASFVPAFRASRADPVQSLRAE